MIDFHHSTTVQEPGAGRRFLRSPRWPVSKSRFFKVAFLVIVLVVVPAVVPAVMAAVLYANDHPVLYNSISNEDFYGTQGNNIVNNDDSIAVGVGTFSGAPYASADTVYYTVEIYFSLVCSGALHTCVFDGLNSRRLMFVMGTGGGTIRLSGIHFKDGFVDSNSGGALSFYDAALVSIEVCKISSNQATYGGGLYARNRGTTINIYTTGFDGNTVTNYGDDIYTNAADFIWHSNCPPDWSGTPTPGSDLDTYSYNGGTVSGTIKSFDIGTCTFSGSCPPGEYKIDSMDFCDNCEPGKFSGEGSSSCSSCPAGKYLTNAATSVESSACTSCSSGQYGGTASATCSPCASGKYLTNAATGVESSACTDCSAGQYSGSASVSCSLCDAGKSSTPPASSCFACAMGTHSPTGSPCLDCEAGKYNQNLQQGSCTNCGTGRYSSTTGNTAVSFCLNCEAGKTSSEVIRTTPCPACPEGTSAPAPGLSFCRSCPAGTYSNNPDGAANCALCGIGKYGSATQSTSCDDCVAGTFNLVEGSVTCDKCPAGQKMNDAGNGCAVCPNGKLVYG
ncbi:hypothetical protein TrCOL_g9321 [Triparma columacea]|uniref:Tyrosine-protein kinase ephrin type A/B receptor-like domain-containing protein n=1 Tax=Triparma columacea TaxID=722753 RepID=A0A9W7GH66_9STRA|nr:hypothetical protein TrCOL_g9321 [Triparma columacea]